MGFRKLIVLIGIALTAMVMPACSGETDPETHSPSFPQTSPDANNHEPSAAVVVSTDFGAEIILEETVAISGNTTALSALKSVIEVETEYGGGFVSAIGGISSEYGDSGNKKDWFFYINGFSSNTGAAAYILNDGDLEHWDFHDWGFRQFIPGIAGEFPEPFLHGYGGEVRPTLVCCQEGWEDSARSIAEHLSGLGVAEVAVRSPGELTTDEQESANLILLGTAEFPLIDEMNQVWNKIGLFARFEDGKLKTYDGAGELDMEYGEAAGVIQAAQNPWNTSGTGVCQNVAWMVSGLDEAGVESTVAALLTNSDAFRYGFGAVTVGGEIIRVPR